MNIKFSIAIAALVLFASCSSNKGTAQSAVEIKSVNVDEFEKLLKETNNKTVLDVRTPGEFESGHIKDAININVNGDAFEAGVHQLDTNKAIYVYCLAGSRSMKAAEILQGMGFKSIYNLTGGISAWNGAGKPVETGKSTPAKGMTKLEFDKLVLHGDTLVLVDFNAEWCAPCKKIKAFLPEIEKEFAGKLVIVKIDYDSNMDLAREIKVNNVPYLFLMKGGMQQWEHPGFADKVELKKAIENALAKK
jgi:thioredoxin 1